MQDETRLGIRVGMRQAGTTTTRQGLDVQGDPRSPLVDGRHLSKVQQGIKKPTVYSTVRDFCVRGAPRIKPKGESEAGLAGRISVRS